MSIALRDAPRGGQDGARLDFYKFSTNVNKTADVTEQPKTCGGVAP